MAPRYTFLASPMCDIWSSGFFLAALIEKPTFPDLA